MYGVLILGAISALVVAVQPEWRLRVQTLIFGDDRELLASVTGTIGDRSDLKILKIRTRLGVVIEVHSKAEADDHTYVLLDKVVIPDRHDGYFIVSGQTTQLALVDVDNDGRLDIVAPTFDDKLVAHLNAFRLDPTSNKLKLIGSQGAP